MPNVIVNVATSAATEPAAAEQVERQHRVAAPALAPQERGDARRRPRASATVKAGAMRAAFDQDDGQRAEAEHRQRLARHVDARGVGVAGFGKVAVRHQQRADADGRVQPEDVAPAQACRSARRRGSGRWRC